MKLSTALSLGLVPLSLARRVRNSYPPIRRDVELDARNWDVAQGNEEHVSDVHDLLKGGDLVVDEMKGHGFTANAKTEIIIIWANPGAGAEKTTYNEKITVTETVTAPPGGEATPPPAAAATHTVTVGGPGGLIYEPDQLENVPVGDMVIFEFLAQNHTVTQSTFDAPCAAMEGGMDTGHQPNPNNTVVPAPQVAMQVTSGDPLCMFFFHNAPFLSRKHLTIFSGFYCKTGNHCGEGMVFSINPTEEKSQAAFKEKAIAQNGEGEATPITGGEPPADEADNVGDQPEGGQEPPADDGSNAGEQPEGGEAVQPGQGVIGQDGSCLCMVTCSSSAFPAADSQGLGARGGYPGSLDVRMAGISS